MTGVCREGWDVGSIDAEGNLITDRKGERKKVTLTLFMD